MTLEARCHCGDTRIALSEHPTRAARCNCSFCQRTGAVWAYYEPGDLEVLSSANQGQYSTNPDVGRHYFCSRCGMQTWGESLDWDAQDGPQSGDAAPHFAKQQLNLNLVDDLDWSRIKVEALDGRNAW